MTLHEDDSRLRWRSGDAWEEAAGYSRAVRHGDVIAVSGTTANGAVGAALYEGDTYAQTRMALETAIRSVEHLGGTVESVYRTRIMLVPEADWKAASRAHVELLGSVAPANSMFFVNSLIGEGYLVEVEIDARVAAA